MTNGTKYSMGWAPTSHRLVAGIAMTLSILVIASSTAMAAGPAGPEQAKLYASDAETEVGFGFEVAISGDTALIASLGTGPMTGADGQPSVSLGAVYVFTRTGALWTEQAKLTASDAALRDSFGSSVALSGNTALIGAERDDDAGESSGSAYLFQRVGTAWSELTKLTASDAAEGDRFGSSVAIDGNIALIAAEGDDDRGANAGSVYTFSRPGIEALALGIPGGQPWSQEAKLTASDASQGQFFGSSVALSGITALIGADGDDDAGPHAGAAYVFARHDTDWIEEDKLTAADTARFGSSVAIDGGTALIGAPGGPQFDISGPSAFVFTRDIDSFTTDPMGGSTTWSQQAKLTTSNSYPDSDFGRAVAISGNAAVIGAWYGDALSNMPGSAHVFTRAANVWSEQTTLTATPAPGAVDTGDSAYFGGSVAMSGGTALIGSGLDDDIAWNSGAAYVFVTPEPLQPWTAEKKTMPRSEPRETPSRNRSIALDSCALHAQPRPDTHSGCGSPATALSPPLGIR